MVGDAVVKGRCTYIIDAAFTLVGLGQSAALGYRKKNAVFTTQTETLPLVGVKRYFRNIRRSKNLLVLFFPGRSIKPFLTDVFKERSFLDMQL